MERPILEQSEVAAAKARWLSKNMSRRRRKATLTFDDYLELFSSGHTLSQVAKRAGVSRQSTHILYKNFFEPLFKKSGRAIGKEAYVRAREERLDVDREILFADPDIKKIADIAREAGCCVEAVERYAGRTELRVRRDRLRINGYLCAVHKSRSVDTPPLVRKRFYYRFSISWSRIVDVHFVIFDAHAPGFEGKIFIVPTTSIVRAYKYGENVCKILYLPTETTPPKRNVARKMNYLQYLNAWEQLKQEESAA